MWPYIDFGSSGLKIDAGRIDAEVNDLARTARDLTIDAACIEVETLPVTLDGRHIERAGGASSIHAAYIDGETTPRHARCRLHRFWEQGSHDP
jgi:hypothetical protein